MKVAFFHELHFGGARRVVGAYAEVFAKYHDIELYYTGNNEENDFDQFFSKSHFFQFSFQKYEGNNWKLKFYKDFIEPIKLYFLHKKIAKGIDKQDFDFIFVHPSQFTHAPFILRFLKTPLVYFCQEPLRIAHDPTVTIPGGLSLPKYLYERLIRRIRKQIDYSNICKAQLVLANCEYTKDNIKNAYDIDAKVCYLAVDPHLFHPITIKKKYDLLYVGDAIKMEGYDTLEQINKLFKNKLKIFVVKKRKGKRMTDEELVETYNSSRLVVVLGKYDPFSMIPLEAMACSVPPLVVNEGGPIEAVESGRNGFLIDRDPELFATKIKELLDNNTQREKIGKNGRKKVLEFWTWEESYHRLMNIVAEAKLIR